MTESHRKLDASIVQQLHEMTLTLPWTRSGTNVDWSLLSHVTLILPDVPEGVVIDVARSCPLGRHDRAVLFAGLGSEPVLCSLAEALDSFDAILQGPGFVFGADLDASGTGSVGLDLAYFDGGDRLTFLLYPPSSPEGTAVCFRVS